MKKSLLQCTLAFCGALSMSLLMQVPFTGHLRAAPPASLAGSMSLTLLEEQDMEVSGTISDTEGEPLPGVTVSVQGGTTGTATDLNGRYRLSVPQNASLVFSFIGFESQVLPVGDRSVIDVVLTEHISALEEVVVVGYGSQREVNVTGSISVVD